MADLSPKEQHLLKRVGENAELQVLFFRKVKGIKWFHPLNASGYFNPEHNPRPKPAKKSGNVTIPTWNAIEYLVRTAPTLVGEENEKIAAEFLKIIIQATIHARDNGISNYRTWWQFAEIIYSIPSNYISAKQLDIIDYWLDDEYDRAMVAEQLGEKWLLSLLNENTDNSKELASRVIFFLYKPKFFDRKYGEKSQQEASLRFDYYHAKRITDTTASLAGEKIGLEAVEHYGKSLELVLSTLGNDSWSSVWQPAIEVHEQNKHREDAENILIRAVREALVSLMRFNKDDCIAYVNNCLDSEYETFQRIGIYLVGLNPHQFKEKFDSLIHPKYLKSNFRHEMWHFLNKSYTHFQPELSHALVGMISELETFDDEGGILEGATAYKKATWFSAIKDQGPTEKNYYDQQIKIAGAEPDHPDFSSYFWSSSGWGEDTDSPKTLEELAALSTRDLVDLLISYEEGGEFTGISALTKVVKELFLAEPLKHLPELNKFITADIAYVHSIIEAYSEKWNAKAELPWDDVWAKLIQFSHLIIQKKDFWNEVNAAPRTSFVANRNWLVTSISDLIKSGVKSDKYAFNQSLLGAAEEVLVGILSKQEGTVFEDGGDAVSQAINSPRGHCVEALINLTLRCCRLEDATNDGDHSLIWIRFQQIYDRELQRVNEEVFWLEFPTLVTNYLPNFLYLSSDWVVENLSVIFNQENDLWWKCAMQGYSYTGNVNRDIYDYLKENGDLIRALDKKIKDTVERKVIQNIAVAYIYNFESIGDQSSLINQLLERNVYEEMHQLIWFFWTAGKKADQRVREKLFELWPLILSKLDLSTLQGKKLASDLCFWTIFVESVDDEKLGYITKIAPFADESHNSSYLIQSIAKISKSQPAEAFEIWDCMLEGSHPIFPGEAVKEALSNIANSSTRGRRNAGIIVSKYLKVGAERPAIWLDEMIEDAEDSLNGE